MDRRTGQTDDGFFLVTARSADPVTPTAPDSQRDPESVLPSAFELLYKLFIQSMME